MSEPVFHRPLKICVLALIAAGVVMAITALIAAVIYGETGQAWAFFAVASVLASAAGAVVRGVRWVTAVCFVAFGGQIVAIIGTAIELAGGVADVKQQQLHSLGFDPAVAVALNLIYSTVGFGLFCWLAWRWRAQPRRRSST